MEKTRPIGPIACRIAILAICAAGLVSAVIDLMSTSGPRHHTLGHIFFWLICGAAALAVGQVSSAASSRVRCRQCGYSRKV